jgi:hypothetical protein
MPHLAGIVNVILALSFERVSPLNGECRCQLGQQYQQHHLCGQKLASA